MKFSERYSLRDKLREERIKLNLVRMARLKIPNMIIREVVNHLDFEITIDLPNKQYILKNIRDNQKFITLYKIAITPTNQYADFIWPSSLTAIRNNNYTYTIQGIRDKHQDLDPEITIDCSESWSIIFDNYDNNTNIHLFGLVAEPHGMNVNI